MQVKKSYEPVRLHFKEEITEFEACKSTQEELDRAITKYGRSKSIFVNVRSDISFEKVERELIDTSCLEEKYNKAPSKDCLYIIKNGDVCCVCHSDVKQIEKNIEWAKQLSDSNDTSEKSDFCFVGIGCLILLAGLFG